MIHFQAIPVKITPFAASFFDKLIAVAIFEMYDFKPFLRKITGIKEDNDAPFNDKFDQLDYGSSYSLINLGQSTFLLLLILPLLYTVAFLITKLPCRGQLLIKV